MTNRLLRTPFILVFSLVPVLLKAQDTKPSPADSNNLELKEVVVTDDKINKFSEKVSPYVARMPLNRLENPQVYTSITKELLTEQLIFSVDDATRNAPGIQKMWNATGRAGDGGGYYNIRGFIVQSQFRNGIAGNVTSTIDAANLERVEIIKGPSATLFGSGLTSYGGLINRVTKKPYREFGGEVSVSGGNFGFHRFSADVNTPVDRAGKLLIRTNAAYNYEDSFQDQVFNRSFAAAPSLVYRPSDRLSVHLDAELYYNRGVGRPIYFFYYPAAALGVTRADELNIDYDGSFMGEGLTQNSRSSNFFGQVNYQLSETFTSSTNFTFSNSFSEGFYPFFYPVPDSLVTGNPADADQSNFLVRGDQSTRNSRNRALEIQQNFNGDFRIGELRNRFLLGLDFLRVNSSQLFFGTMWFDVVPSNDPSFDYSGLNGDALQAVYNQGENLFTWPADFTTNTYSAYISDVLDVTDRLSVLAALRVDHFENKGGVEGQEVEPFSQTAFSPKFGLVFQPVKDRVSLFANYQNSFNNPGAYTVYDPTAPDSRQTSIAKPEQANQIEGGVKLDVLDGRLSTTLSYYDIRVKNILRADAGAPIPDAQVQDGTQLSKGIELEVIANPLQGMNIVAGFSYNDSKLDKADADVNGRRPATAASPYLANCWISYRLPGTVTPALKGLGLGFGGNYASDNKILNSVSMGEFILPAYTVLNATVFYDQPKYRIGFKVDNLTNERYWIGYTTANPQKLRSFVASLSYKF